MRRRTHRRRRIATNLPVVTIEVYQYGSDENWWYEARLVSIDGKPYTGQYDGTISEMETAQSGPKAIQKLGNQWNRAGFLD